MFHNIKRGYDFLLHSALFRVCPNERKSMIMEKIASIDELLEAVTNVQQRTIDFYTNLAEKTTQPQGEVLMDFVREEMMHKKKVMDILDQAIFVMPDNALEEFDLAHALHPHQLAPGKSLEESLAIAQGREKEMEQVMEWIAGHTKNDEMKALFGRLGEEKAKRLARFDEIMA